VVSLERFYADKRAKARKKLESARADKHRAEVERQEAERMARLNRIAPVPYSQIDRDPSEGQ
jgi:hypothetical protein